MAFIDVKQNAVVYRHGLIAGGRRLNTDYADNTDYYFVREGRITGDY